MNNDRKTQEKAENAHFMAVLDGAIHEAGLTYIQVDARIGVSEGMTGRWVRNAQIMRATTFVKVALAVGSDPVELTSRAMKRLKASGLLDDVEILPAVDAEQPGK
jgi:hypothetical protein